MVSFLHRVFYHQKLDIFFCCVSYFTANTDLHLACLPGRRLDFDKRAPLWHHQTLGPGSERSLPSQHLLQSAGGGHWHRTLEHDPQPRGTAGCQGLGLHTHKHKHTRTQWSPDVKRNQVKILKNTQHSKIHSTQVLDVWGVLYWFSPWAFINLPTLIYWFLFLL